MTEARIQQEIVMWYWNTFPDRRGTLIEINNNPRNAIDGARRKAMGMVKGASDLALILPDGVVVFVECKLPTGVQSEAQKDWEELVKEMGCRYEIVRSLEDFKRIFYPI